MPQNSTALAGLDYLPRADLPPHSRTAEGILTGSRSWRSFAVDQEIRGHALAALAGSR